MSNHATTPWRVRFLQKINWDGPVPAHGPSSGPCAIWDAGHDVGGYGKFTIATTAGWQTWKAHRLMWVVAFDADPGDQHVLHRCDNRPCCAPTHLWLGTEAENMADMVAKGRTLKGERHNLARLTEAQVLDIRARYERPTGKRGNGELLAQEFGVTRTMVYDIVHRHNWTHI